MRAILLLTLTLATPVGALEYAPDCYIAGAGDEKVGFYAEGIGNGFVSYWIGDLPVGQTWIVLEHCASTQRMTARYDNDEQDSANAIRLQWEAMVEGEAQYTLPQIAQSLKSLGATTRVQRTGMESCACKLLAKDGLGQGAYQPDVLP
jgi:hypothetical protein